MILLWGLVVQHLIRQVSKSSFAGLAWSLGRRTTIHLGLGLMLAGTGFRVSNRRSIASKAQQAAGLQSTERRTTIHSKRVQLSTAAAPKCQIVFRRGQRLSTTDAACLDHTDALAPHTTTTIACRTPPLLHLLSPPHRVSELINTYNHSPAGPSTRSLRFLFLNTNSQSTLHLL